MQANHPDHHNYSFLKKKYRPSKSVLTADKDL